MVFYRHARPARERRQERRKSTDEHIRGCWQMQKSGSKAVSAAPARPPPRRSPTRSRARQRGHRPPARHPPRRCPRAAPSYPSSCSSPPARRSTPLQDNGAHGDRYPPRITARMAAVIRQAQQRWVAGGTPAAQAAEARNKPRQHHEEKALATMLSRAPLENPYCTGTSSRSKRFGKKAAGRMQLRRIIGSDSFRRKEALPSTAPETAGRLRAKKW